jgi:hypothetical protein
LILSLQKPPPTKAPLVKPVKRINEKKLTGEHRGRDDLPTAQQATG